MASRTRTDLANQALLLLGEKPIDHIDADTSEPARTLRALLPEAIREILALYTWQEMVARKTLVPVDLEPDEDGYFKFRLPADWIRLVAFVDYTAEGYDADYRIEGDELFFWEDDSPVVSYVRYSDNPQDFGPLLAQAIYTHLAAKAAFVLTQNPQIGQTLKAELEQVIIPRAQQIQAQTQRRPVPYKRTGNWLKWRRG